MTSSSRAGPQTPTIRADGYRIVEDPSHHLNDFCLFRDHEGTWHCIGIMGTGSWHSEQSFFHWSGKSLQARFTPHRPLLTRRPPANEVPQKHAPYVVRHDEVYHMFYRRPPGTILSTRSPDPGWWESLGKVVFEENDARDVCIRKFDGVYHMYYCQSREVQGIPRSCILLRRSPDLVQWDEPVVVHVDLNEPASHSYLESPFVIAREEGYYLFIRHRLRDADRATVVLFSGRPDRFPSGREAWFAELPHVHAPEIVRHEGRFYLATVSGAPHTGSQEPVGWVEVAELRFE